MPRPTKLAQRLAAQGWIALCDDPGDQRRTLVQITPAGQRKVMPLIAQAQAHELQVLGDMSPAQVQRLKTQLRQLARAPR